jgi:Domain of Unknown Function with PDB structure (DUF3857)/Transglutaminase-like superfamily
MRIPALVRILLLLLAVASPALVRAQFQQPTAEELAMTADPKAPGAAAVYLYREEICNAEQQTYSYYERIKVLADKGKELATISLPYLRDSQKVTDIKGRTIHADGSIVALNATIEDMMDIKAKKFQENTFVFTLPSVEIGSILEYRVTLHFNEYMPLPTWNIQQSNFVHKAHYSLHFTNYSDNFLMYSYKIDSGAKVINKKDDYILDLDDIPPLPDEDWMPPLNTFKWRVEFYLSSFKSGKDFWEYADKSWADAVQEFTHPNGFLKTYVAQIVAPADSDEQKARKIYAAVQKLDNTSFSRQKSKAERKKEKIKDVNNAGDVCKQQSGYDDNIARLYVALARAAGLKVWPMKVVDRNRAIFDASFLSTYQLDDYLAIVELNGKDVYLDPGQKMCPFGNLHWKHTLATGLRLTEKGAVTATTPAGTFKESAVMPSADLIIDVDGGVKGTVRVVMNGPEALRWRQLALENDEEEVRKQFIESMRGDLPEGVQADFDRFQALDGPTVNLVAYVNVSGSLGSVTGKHIFLPGLFFQSRAKHPFVAQDKRIIPIDLHYPKMEQEDVVYHLPSGYTVESAPKIPDLLWPNHALLRMNFTAKNGTVEVQRAFARNFTLLGPSDYNDLHDFYLKIAAADQQPLVLTRTPVAKGN